MVVGANTTCGDRRCNITYEDRRTLISIVTSDANTHTHTHTHTRVSAYRVSACRVNAYHTHTHTLAYTPG